MKNGEIQPLSVIDLKRISELAMIQYNKDRWLKVGALVTASEIASSKIILEKFPFLACAAQSIGSVQIRNRATAGGNICRAAPSADLVLPFLVLDTQLRIKGPDGERKIPLESFFVSPGKTILKENEIVMDMEIPISSRPGIGVYLKLGPRQTMDLATVGVAVFAVFNPDGHTCDVMRIALGSVGPTPLRAKKAEKMIVGEKLDEAIAEAIAKTASEEANPISDVYGSDWYKRRMVKVLVKRAVMEMSSKRSYQ
jgi:carbon-monoxide dehydrogenase medium subunit